MSSRRRRLAPTERLGLTVFLSAIVFTAAFIGYGIAGRPLPDWVLALALVL